MAKKKDYKDKKGATGKQYTTYGDRIKVTYTDGSTRVVRPTDASYGATKKAMESDIAGRNPLGIGNKKSKTTAVNAIGNGVKNGQGLVSSAAVEKKAKQATQKRLTQQVMNSNNDIRPQLKKAGSAGASSLEQARMVNGAVAAALPKALPKTFSGNAIKSGAEQGVLNLKQGTKQGLLALMDSVAPMAEPAGKNSRYLTISPNAPGQKKRDAQLEQKRRNLARETVQKQQAIANKYGSLNTGEQIVHDVIANAIPMVPSMAGGALGGGAAAAAGLTAKGTKLAQTVGAMAPMFNYARGMGEGQALNEGATMDESNRYGLARAIVETGSEMMFAGYGKLMPGMLRPSQFTSKIASPVLKKSADMTLRALGEGTEEVVAEAADPYLQRAIYNPNAQNATLRQLGYAGLLGALTSGVINAGAAGVNMLPRASANAANSLRNPQGDHAADTALHGAPMSERIAQQERLRAANTPVGAETAPQTEQITAQNTQNAQNQAGMEIIQDAINNTIQSNPGQQTANHAADNLEQPVQNGNDVQNRDRTANLQRPTLEMNEPSLQQEAMRSNGETVQQFVDYDISRISPDARQWLERVGSVSGMNVRVVDGLPHVANGMFDSHGDILLDGNMVNSAESMRKVLGHEAYHAMRNTDEHKRLQDFAWEWYQLEHPDATQQDMLNEKIAQYAENGVTLENNDAAWDEVGAEFAERLMTDEAMARRVIAEKPSLAQRIWQTIQNILQRFTGKLSAMEQRQREILQRAEKVYREGLQSMQYAGVAQDGQNSYSIQDPNQKKLPAFVRADRDVTKLFSGADSKQWGRNVEQYINDRIRHGEDLYLQADNGDILAITENTAGKAKFRNTISVGRGRTREMTDAEYRLKLEMECHIDELAAISEPDSWNTDIGNKHAKRGMAQNGWEYRKAYYETLDGRNYEVTLSISQNGEIGDVDVNEVYNVGHFQRRKNTASSLGSSTREGGAHAVKIPNGTYGSANGVSVYKGSIAENDSFGNGLFDNLTEEQWKKLRGDDNEGEVRYSLPMDERALSQPEENVSRNIIVKNIPAESDMQRIKEEYKNSTDEDMYDFIDDARRGGKNRYYRMTDISDTEASDIKQLTGIDVTEFSRKISSDSIRHIENRHGEKGAADSSLKDDADIARMNYVLENYDSIELVEEDSSHYVDKNNNPAPLVRYAKRVNGSYYVVEAVPDTSWKSLQIVTAYKNTKKEALHGSNTGNSSPEHNARNDHAATSFNEVSVPQNEQDVNNKSDIRYSLNNDNDTIGSEEYKALLDEYGAMPEGEDPTGNNHHVEVPRSTAEENQVRQFVRNVIEAPSVDDVTANMVAEKLVNDTSGDLVYEPVANKAVLDDVNVRIAENGWRREYKELHDAVQAGNRITADDVAMGTRLIQEAQKAGDYKAAVTMVTDLAVAGTELGQSIQAYRMLKRLTPEGQLLALKKVQRRINQNLRKQGKKQVTEMSEETAMVFMQARSNQRRDEIWNREIARMGQETEGTWMDKLSALRYAAMLSNPKTHIRNIVGNVVMTIARQPTIFVSASMEELRDKAIRPNGMAPEHYRTIRNRTGQSRKELKKYAEINYNSFAKQMLQSGGSRYQDVSGQFANNQRVFGNSLPGRVLEQLAGNGKRSVSSALEAEDMWFKHKTYVSALVGYMRANGITAEEAAKRIVKPNGASIEKGEQYALLQAAMTISEKKNMIARWGIRILLLLIQKAEQAGQLTGWHLLRCHYLLA